MTIVLRDLLIGYVLCALMVASGWAGMSLSKSSPRNNECPEGKRAYWIETTDGEEYKKCLPIKTDKKKKRK